jgi:hypothetical protein
MIRYGVPIAIMSIITIIIHFAIRSIAVYPISDTLFFAGQLFFFYGLIRITNATEIFVGFGYSYRQMFSRRPKTDVPKTFFELQERRREAKEKRAPGTSGLVYLLGSVVMIAISLNITV